MVVRGFWLDVLTNVAADAIFLFSLIALTFGLGFTVWQRRVRRFFGLTRRKFRIQIYLSSISVIPRGTRPFIGDDLVEGFHGDAITELEYYYALRLSSAVHVRPALLRLME